jgi:hypothetical protein
MLHPILCFFLHRLSFSYLRLATYPRSEFSRTACVRGLNSPPGVDNGGCECSGRPLRAYCSGLRITCLCWRNFATLEDNAYWSFILKESRSACQFYSWKVFRDTCQCHQVCLCVGSQRLSITLSHSCPFIPSDVAPCWIHRWPNAT